MSDLNTLLADIDAWLARDDLGSVALTLVRLAEQAHRRDIRVRDMIRRARADGQDSVYLALPLGYLEMRRLDLVTQNSETNLRQVAPEALNPGRDSGHITRYCIHREIEFNATATGDQSFEMVYYEAFTALDETNPANWLIENAYDCYLYGALKHAEPYLRDDERVGVWGGLYSDAIFRLNREEQRGRWGKGEMRVMVQGMTP